MDKLENALFTESEILAVALIRDEFELAAWCRYTGTALKDQQLRDETLKRAIVYLVGSSDQEASALQCEYFNWYRASFLEKLSNPHNSPAQLHAAVLVIELRNIGKAYDQQRSG